MNAIKLFFWTVSTLLVMCAFVFGQQRYTTNDSHFHVTNMIQEGVTLNETLGIMDEYGVERSAVFGVPLQQHWNMLEDVKPSYYLHGDGRLYYYSATDAILAVDYLSLTNEMKLRFDPMITGFNPSDGYATDHIRRMLLTFPGVFSGIGEFVVKKEVLSGLISGGATGLNSPSLKKIFAFAKEVGLVVIFHSDIDTMQPVNKEMPTYFEPTLEFFRSALKPTVIWAHTGLGRYIKESPNHLRLLRKVLDELPNVYLDIAWTVVADQIVKDDETIARWAKLIEAYPTRFIYGSDAVAPSIASYKTEINMYSKLWKALPEKLLQRVRKDNYRQIFDAARLKVRRWEKSHLK